MGETDLLRLLKRKTGGDTGTKQQKPIGMRVFRVMGGGDKAGTRRGHSGDKGGSYYIVKFCSLFHIFTAPKQTAVSWLNLPCCGA